MKTERINTYHSSIWWKCNWQITVLYCRLNGVHIICTMRGSTADIRPDFTYEIGIAQLLPQPITQSTMLHKKIQSDAMRCDAMIWWWLLVVSDIRKFQGNHNHMDSVCCACDHLVDLLLYPHNEALYIIFCCGHLLLMLLVLFYCA